MSVILMISTVDENILDQYNLYNKQNNKIGKKKLE